MRARASFLFAALSCFVAISLPASKAAAAFVLSPTFSYEERKDESGSTTSKITTTIFDIRLGYLMPEGLYVGGLYNTETTDYGSTTEKGTSYGASLGFFAGGFNLIGTYHLAGELSYTGGTKRTEGKGPQIDIGYSLKISEQVLLGPQLTWRSLEYDKLKSGSVTVDSNYKRTEIRPMIALFFMF